MHSISRGDRLDLIVSFGVAPSDDRDVLTVRLGVDG